MAEEIAGLVVTLDEKTSEEKAHRIALAISMISGVAHVNSHETDFSHVMAKNQAKSELIQRVNQVIQDY